MQLCFSRAVGTTQPFAKRAAWWSAPRWVIVLAVLWIAAALITPFARAQDDVTSPTGDDFLSALESAEQDGTGYVTFDQDTTVTLTAPVEIPTDMIIDSAGFNVQINATGSNVFAFQVDPAVNFTVMGLTISGGQNTNGGAIYIEYDPTDSGALVLLTNCVLEGNSALGTNGSVGGSAPNSTVIDGSSGQKGYNGSPGLGGAIFNLGNLALLNCLVSNNVARGGTGGAGGNGGNGGGELSKGGNGGGGGLGGLAWGGAICNFGTSLLLSNCTFAANSAIGGDGGTGGTGGTGFTHGLNGSGAVGGTAYGGGLYSTSAIVVVNCTFADNVAQGGASASAGTASSYNGGRGPSGPNSYGGGIYLIGQDGLESDVTNCTFFDNLVIGGTGGAGGTGLINGGQGGSGGTGTGGGYYFMAVKATNFDVGGITYSTNVMVNCTFSGCGAFPGTNGAAGTGSYPGRSGPRGSGHGGNVASGAGRFMLLGCIIGTNISGMSGSGKFIDAGYNLLQDNSIALGKKSKKAVKVQLGPLQNNGGSTPTMALITPSPATNRIPAELAPSIDQRGVPRPASGNLADVGAFELVTKPIILTAPLNIIQTNSGLVTFSVQALGNEQNTANNDLFYQWRIGGTNITGAEQSNYTVLSAVVTNQGGYDVVVSSSSGIVTSTPSAYVLFPPYIINQMAATNQVPAGSNLTLSVVVSGTVFDNLAIGMTNYPELRYQWQLNGTNLFVPAIPTNGDSFSTMLTNGLFESHQTISYTIAGFTNSSGSNVYTLAVTNFFGGITSAPCVIVVGPSFIIPPPSTPIPAALGSSVNVTVLAGGTPPLNYTWTGPNGQVYQTGPTLNITGIQPNQYGFYTITVQNGSGSSASSISEQVDIVPLATVPIISSQPTNMNVLPGSNVTFSVTAIGATSFTYQWLYGTNLTQSPTAPIPGATNSSLVLANVQITNDGVYAVMVTDTNGPITSSNAVLTVEVPPFIITPPTGQAASLGSNATFTVVAGGGGLSYQWSFNSNNIVGATASTLTVTNVQSTNYGTYAVSITNLAGSTNVSSMLSVPGSSSIAARSETVSGTMAPVVPGAIAGSSGTDLEIISSVSLASNQITFVFPGVANSTYVLEYKSSLGDSDWVPLQTNTPATSGPIIYQDATTNDASRFYRIWVR